MLPGQSVSRRRLLKVIGTSSFLTGPWPSNRTKALAVADAEWPMVHRDPARTSFNANAAGITPLAAARTAWETYGGTHSPVVADGIAYVPAGNLVALDIQNEVSEWAFETDGEVASIALDEDTVYAGAGGLHAVDRTTGTERWAVYADDDAVEAVLHPVISDRTVYAGVGTVQEVMGGPDSTVWRLVAIESETGSERWSVALGSRIEPPLPFAMSGPTIVAGTVGPSNYSPPPNSTVYGISVESGETIWKKSHSRLGGAISVDRKFAYRVVSSGDQDLYSDGYVSATRLSDGTERWRTTTDEMFGTAAVVLGESALGEEVLYVGFEDDYDDRAGVAALDAANGSPGWTTDLPEVAGPDWLAATPDLIYVIAPHPFADRQRIFGLDLPTGERLWSIPIEEEELSPPAVTDGSAFVGGSNLYQLVPNQPPTADFTHRPESPPADVPVTFDASPSSDDGEIVRYEWDFGDTGEFEATGRRVEHSFTSPGTTTVRLRVTDDHGAAGEARTTLKVEEPTATPSPTPTPTSTATPTRTPESPAGANPPELIGGLVLAILATIGAAAAYVRRRGSTSDGAGSTAGGPTGPGGSGSGSSVSGSTGVYTASQGTRSSGQSGTTVGEDTKIFTPPTSPMNSCPNCQTAVDESADACPDCGQAL